MINYTMSQFNENAKWRYATKKYDATRKISEADLATLKEAINLSASSYGLQPYKVIFVENPELRAKLQPASWGQTQIVDASHLIVLPAIWKIVSISNIRIPTSTFSRHPPTTIASHSTSRLYIPMYIHAAGPPSTPPSTASWTETYNNS